MAMLNNQRVTSPAQPLQNTKWQANQHPALLNGLYLWLVWPPIASAIITSHLKEV